MIRAIIRVQDKNTSWTEEIPLADEDKDKAEEVIKDMVNKFNETLQPGEEPRQLVNIESIGEIEPEEYDDEDFLDDDYIDFEELEEEED